ncbi:MAG: DUF6370 family protein [Gemmatales bacterium]|nr:DUF6370 family protein [Gemmatales bacterium]MDW7993609.1 DUF6370 family protein [Gemmatales bacterium]
MRRLGTVVSAMALLVAVGLTQAQDKEVTLKGTITCAKCELKKDNECATVILVKEDGKELVYYFDQEAHKKYHGEICTGGKDGVVAGTVIKEKDKLVIKVSKLSFK